VIAGVIGTFVGFILISVPVAFAIGAAAMIGLAAQGIPLTIMASRVFGGIDSFTLLAIPFFIMAGDLLVIQIYIEAYRSGVGGDRRASLRELLAALRDASWALLMPVIIFGGILGGAFTPTEAAVVAAAYGLVVGMFIYREITWAHVWRIMVRTGVITGTVMLLMATASILGWLLTVLRLPQAAIDAIQAVGGGKGAFLVILLVLCLGLFAVLDGLPAMVMVIPVFLPVGLRLGVEPLHFGILLTAVMGIALFLPPVGVALYVAADIAQTSAAAIGRVLAPYLATMLAVTVAIAFIPEIVYILPRWMGYHVPG